MRFIQTIDIRAEDDSALIALMAAWHEAESGKAPGYLGSRLLADRDQPGRYLLLVEFSSAEEAEMNNDRPQTQEWAAKFSALIDDEPRFGNYDEISAVD
jgi:quinol monooxygenase YgiN